MSETEELKKQTEEQFARERVGAIAAYLDEISEKIAERARWHGRTRNLEISMLLFHVLLTFFMIAIGLPVETIDAISTASLFLFIAVAVRSWVHFARWTRVIGEYEGCITTLQKIGMIKDDESGPGKRRKERTKSKSIFKRYKEFWERMGESNKQEKYV